MTGRPRRYFRSLSPFLVMGGCVAMMLPTALMLAAEKPATRPTTTSAPTTSRAANQREEQITRVMEFFRVTQPDVYEQALAFRQQDPVRFDRLIAGAAPTVYRLEAIRRRNPPLFELSMQDLTLNYQSFRIAHELKRTDLTDGDRKQLREQLASVVAAEFEVQQQIRQMEIDDQREKLRDLDQQIQNRDQNKGKIINKRVDDLIDKAPRLEWQ